jgi:putative flavoprotein involved in K+ transport
VLVVGAGPSGQQIALELVRAGRQVFLSAGAHARVPRRYRGRDIWAWLDALGRFDDTVDDVGEVAARRPTPSVTLTGVDGGEPLDLGVLQRAGAVLGGRLTGFTGHHALFAADLPDTIRTADESMHALLAEIDRHIADTGVEAEPPEEVPAVPVEPGISSLDLTAAGVSAIVWATGYRRSYPWLHAPVLTPRGELEQRDGVTRMAGLYSLGLRFQHRRSSHQIRGVGRDAALLAARILGTPAPARRLHARPRPTRARRAMAAALAA